MPNILHLFHFIKLVLLGLQQVQARIAEEDGEVCGKYFSIQRNVIPKSFLFFRALLRIVVFFEMVSGNGNENNNEI
jgi:hypothetical protein